MAFLAAATVAVLLIHAGLGGKTAPAPETVARSTTVATTTTAASRPKPRPAGRYYVIQKGETFGVVASKFHTTVEQIQALNPGVSSNALHVGQRIRVG